MNLTHKVRYCPCRSREEGLLIHDTDKGRTSGIIIDTPSSFATGAVGTGAAQPNEKKYALVKACVDAFGGTFIKYTCFYIVLRAHRKYRKSM